MKRVKKRKTQNLKEEEEKREEEKLAPADDGCEADDMAIASSPAYAAARPSSFCVPPGIELNNVSSGSAVALALLVPAVPVDIPPGTELNSASSGSAVAVKGWLSSQDDEPGPNLALRD